MSGVYEGYHREWRLDPEWRLGTRFKLCRQPRCLNPPVAEFDRMVRYPNSMRQRKQAYAYCEKRLYGRKIENGQVLHNILVKDDEQ